MVEFKNWVNIIKEEVKLAFSNNKGLLFFSILVFIIPLVIGYIYADQISTYIQPVVENFEKQVENGTVTLTTHSLFLNNFKVSLILYALSALGGVLGLFVLFNNGLFIGFYGKGYDLLSYIILTLPHGIFELPAIIISTTGGLVLLSFILHFIYNLFYPDYSYVDIFDPYFSDVKISAKQRISAAFNKNKNKIKESFVLLCVSVVLLLIAATIEANLTIPFAYWISSIFGNAMAFI